MTRVDPAPITRRTLLQAGGLGLCGLDLASLSAAREAADHSESQAAARSVLFIFLSGGLSQLDSFDMKPQAPAEIRGEFQPVATRTPGMQTPIGSGKSRNGSPSITAPHTKHICINFLSRETDSP